MVCCVTQRRKDAEGEQAGSNANLNQDVLADASNRHLLAAQNDEARALSVGELRPVWSVRTIGFS